MSLSLDKSGWKRVAFGNVVRNINDTVRDPEGAGIDCTVAMEHLDPGELRIARRGSLDAGTTFNRRVRPGQTLFGKRRAYQRKVAYAEFEAICSSDILTLDADGSQLVPELLPFLVQSNGFFDHALGTSAGSLSPRTNWRDLANFEFELPPLDEQERVADLLWGVERHRLALRATSSALERARGVWVSQAFARVPTHRRLVEGLIASAYGPRFSNSLYSDEAAYRLLRTTDMDDNGNVDYSTMPRAALNATYDSHLLQDGDFLISRSGTCGVPAVFDASEGGPKVIPGAFLIRLRLNQDLDPHYLRAFFNSEPGRATTNALAQGGVQKNIRGSSLLEVNIPFPTRPEQQAFLDEVAVYENALGAIAAETSAVIALKASILADIFGGN